MEVYNKESLLKLTSIGYCFEYIPVETGLNSMFSLQNECPFECDGIIYQSIEMYLAVERTRLFGSYPLMNRIMKENDRSTRKRLILSTKVIRPQDWESYRFVTCLNAMYQKTNQNKDMREFLLQNKQAIFVYASRFDLTWGAGIGKNSKFLSNPEIWVGDNEIGFIMTTIRDQLLYEMGKQAS